MKRRDLVIALAASIVAPRCLAQPSGKRFRIGLLFVTNRAITEAVGNLPPFMAALREYGYTGS